MSMEEDQEKSNLSGLRILYIEDDEGLARLLQKQLQRIGQCSVDTAFDATQGLTMLKEQHFDAALVDYNLPVVSGLQLINILRDNGMHIPVIILTGAGNEKIAANVLKAGAFDYIIKSTGDDYLHHICRSVREALHKQQKKAQHKVLFAKRELVQKVFDVSREGIIVTNAENIIEAVNPAFTEITGYSYDETVGKNPKMLQSGKHDEQFYKLLWQSINTSDHWKGEIWNKKKSGEIYPEWLEINAVREHGVITQHVAVFTDITGRKASEEKIWHQANHDPLTNLPNRTLLMDRADEAMQRARRDKTSMAVIYLDLDHFKGVNDHYGHAVGDQLLIAAAGRISSTIRKSDSAIRVSGDEFVVLMPILHLAADAGHVVEKIISEVSLPYQLGENEIHISASAGIAVFPGDGDDVEALMNHADVAMYKAKKDGRNQHLFFNQTMNEAEEKRANIEADLQLALKEGQLMMYYQPVLDLRTHQINHAEALIRWQHPVKGLIMPDDFIPVAEQCGLIFPLGEWVTREVCGQMNEWTNQRAEPLQIFLNVSPMQMLHGNFGKQMVWALNEFNIQAGSIGIELTENILIEGPDRVKPAMDNLKASGLNFMLDDFGTGFSSMRYLRKLPFDGLKIDRSFVSLVDQDHEKAVLVNAMISMAHSLNLKVIAEGVEREEELAFLRTHDCDFVQGYLMGRPMPADQFFAMLQKSGQPQADPATRLTLKDSLA